MGCFGGVLFRLKHYWGLLGFSYYDISGKVNLKDGYAVADCRDPRVRRVLEFLVPLLYPERPTRVMITVGNTIFGALSGERPVDWGIVVKDLV